jgi:hypothetical protein
MAAYFQLLDRTTGEATSFTEIDKNLCQHFEQPVDEDKWLCDWYNSIGLRVATGQTLEQVKTTFLEYIIEGTKESNVRKIEGYNNLVKILDWIAERYTTDSWTGK